MSAPPLAAHFDKSWQAHVASKALVYEVEGVVRSSAALRAADDIGGVALEIARLREATRMLATARREAKGASRELQDNVAQREEQVAKRLAAAERENATVYLQVSSGGWALALAPWRRQRGRTRPSTCR